MNEVKITDYLPEAEEISTETLVDVRTRISTYLESRFADSIDMSPNSVFGDLILSPLSYLIASFEIAASRLFSDIDLANVAEGQIYNCDFVKEYLDNFGLSQRVSTPSTGVVRVTFSQPGSYILDAATRFIFTYNGQEYAYAMADVTDFIQLEYDIPEGSESETKKELNRTGEDEYSINIPVIGPAGVHVEKDVNCATNITIPEVVEVKSVAIFDPGVLPENVMELANKTRNTYYAASLSSRNGCLSFLLQTYPELRGVSPVVSGDAEIFRTTENLFGVQQGVMDIFVKSKRNFITDTTSIPLAYNGNLQRWVGKLTTNQGPPVRILDIKLAGEDTSIDEEDFEIVGKVTDIKKYPGLSGSYSPNEKLGLYINQDPENLGEDPVLSPDLIDVTGVCQIQASGSFQGYPFETGGSRLVTLEINSYSSDLTIINATLQYDQDLIDIEFEKTSHVNAVATYNLKETDNYKRRYAGIALNINVSGNPADLKNQLEALLANDEQFTFTVTPRNTNFLVTYEYDPSVMAIHNFVSKNDIKPINTDLQVRSFLCCEVTNITITYRTKAGGLMDLNNARTDIASYVNGLAYPNLYESYAIGEILLYYGAEGVSTVAQQGIFSRTVATKYLDESKSVADVVEGNLFIDQMKNEFVDAYDLVEKVDTTTLIPPKDLDGIGDRNIHYILDPDNIVFDEVSF